MTTDNMIMCALLCALLEEFAERRYEDVPGIFDTVFAVGVAAAGGDAATFYRAIKKVRELDLDHILN